MNNLDESIAGDLDINRIVSELFESITQGLTPEERQQAQAVIMDLLNKKADGNNRSQEDISPFPARHEVFDRSE